MSNTFADLGIPFPLFEGRSDQTNEYCGIDTCSLCGTTGQHCFRLGIGGDVVLDCPRCGAVNGLDADGCEDVSCRQCRGTVRFPEIDDDEVRACYACLRTGKAALTKDTEFGMISWEQAVEGVTHGVPHLHRPDFEMVRKQGGWVGVRMTQEMMFELLRTPTYCTIQGEQWMFCCGRPMISLGEWSREEFSSRAPDRDGRTYFSTIVKDDVPGLWEDELHDVTGVYVFRCPSCERMVANWDIA